jgi:ribosomal 50S subunit-recycling heat shock protein
MPWFRDGGSVIKSYNDVKIDDELTVKLSEGNLGVKVIEKYK